MTSPNSSSIMVDQTPLVSLLTNETESDKFLSNSGDDISMSLSNSNCCTESVKDELNNVNQTPINMVNDDNNEIQEFKSVSNHSSEGEIHSVGHDEIIFNCISHSNLSSNDFSENKNHLDIHDENYIECKNLSTDSTDATKTNIIDSDHLDKCEESDRNNDAGNCNNTLCNSNAEINSNNSKNSLFSENKIALESQIDADVLPLSISSIDSSINFAASEPVNESNTTLPYESMEKSLFQVSGDSEKKNYANLERKRVRDAVNNKINKFFTNHGLRLKIRKLPLQDDESMNSTGDNKNEQLPMYHFITRQRRHMTEQLLRNRSFYKTQFNTLNDRINYYSPYCLKELHHSIHDHLKKMSSDFDDPEFSGVWLSLHTQPFVTTTEFGSLSRSKIVAWALIEVLTTNERCLKALWIHPRLSATSTSVLLKGFLPKIIYEAFELVAPQAKDSCQWKFVYCWLNDFDMLPRQTWLLLTSEKFLNFPKHFDSLGESEDDESYEDEIHSKKNDKKKKTEDKDEKINKKDTNDSEKIKESDDDRYVGHVDTGCICQKTAIWEDFDQVLVGCTEDFMYDNMENWLEKLLQDTVDQRLLRDVSLLPDENINSMKLPSGGVSSTPDVDGGKSIDTTDESTMEESKEMIFKAESLGLSHTELDQLFKYLYGNKGKKRVRSLDDVLKLDFDASKSNAPTSDDIPSIKKVKKEASR